MNSEVYRFILFSYVLGMKRKSSSAVTRTIFVKIMARLRGFNLIEAAIVLGVVGLIIGGIWVATSAVNTQIKLRQTMAGILIIAKNLQSAVTVADSNQMGSVVDLAPLLLRSFPLPPGWSNPSGNTIRGPFNSSVPIVNYANPARFDFALENLNEADCRTLLTYINAQGFASEVGAHLRVFNSVGTMTLIAYTFPATLTGSECSGATNHIYLNFRFNRN